MRLELRLKLRLRLRVSPRRNLTLSSASGQSGAMTLAHGEECRFACESGYTISGTISCSFGNVTEPTCQPSPCDATALPANAIGVGSCTAQLSHGDSCQPQCDPSYYIAVGNTTCSYGETDPTSCTLSCFGDHDAFGFTGNGFSASSYSQYSGTGTGTGSAKSSSISSSSGEGYVTFDGKSG